MNEQLLLEISKNYGQSFQILDAAKSIGAGSASIALAGVGVGIGVVFNGLFNIFFLI